MTTPNDKIKITREELFTSEVDDRLRQEQALLGKTIIPEEDIPRWRRILLSSMFYFPAAGFLGAFLAWAITESSYEDSVIIAGEIVMVNQEPFEVEGADGLETVSISLSSSSMWVYPAHTDLEPGLDGQKPFESIASLAPGTLIEAAGVWVEDQHVAAMAIRPCTQERVNLIGESQGESELQILDYLLFPLVTGLIVFFITLFEGLSTRNWHRMLRRMPLSILLSVVFTLLALIPSGIAMTMHGMVLTWAAETLFYATAHNLSHSSFIAIVIFRSLAWACLAAGLGVGMNMVRSTSLQLRNSVLGGILGGVLGGILFDPIARFLTPASPFSGGELSRVIGFTVIGLCIGFFIALVQRMGREAWIRVCTGPLTGKSFVLHRSPTTIGSASEADIYLFKDPEIDPAHASIHRVGTIFEIEDLGSRYGVKVGEQQIRTQRLVSGDQITIGATILQFEERVNQTFSGSAGASTESVD